MKARQALIKELNEFHPFDEEERQDVQKTITFLKDEPRAFERGCLEGHVTGSAFVVDESGKYLLLTHHLKLGKWIQLGGHCDGDENVFAVAKQEVREETGLKGFKTTTGVFDVSVHGIPEYKDILRHLHYDIRYLFVADRSQKLTLRENESRELRWVSVEELGKWWADSHVLKRIQAKLYSRIGTEKIA